MYRRSHGNRDPVYGGPLTLASASTLPDHRPARWADCFLSLDLAPSGGRTSRPSGHRPRQFLKHVTRDRVVPQPRYGNIPSPSHDRLLSIAASDSGATDQSFAYSCCDYPAHIPGSCESHRWIARKTRRSEMNRRAEEIEGSASWK